MAGIMIPITMSQGVQRAREDNRADQQFAMNEEFNQKRLQGLDMQMRRDQMATDEMEQGKPLRDLKRKAEMTSEMARQAYVMLDSGHPEWGQIPDDQVGAFMAKFLTDTPVFGEVKLMPNGALSDGEREMPMDRKTALKMLAGFADPNKAMELAQREQQYINEKGQVETMTAGEAKGRGLEMAGDKAAGYAMHKAGIEDQYAEENARLGLNVKKAQISSYNRANREKPDEMQFVSPDGKTVKTMLRADGIKAGWTPYGDFTATQKLSGLGEDPYDFSKQTPDAIRKGIFEQSMMDNGYTPVETYTAMGATIEWKTPDGKPVPPEEVRTANEIADEALWALSEGRAKDPVDAMRRAKAKRSAPPVAGAQQAPDGNWYVQKEGKWFRVRQ